MLIVKKARNWKTIYNKVKFKILIMCDDPHGVLQFNLNVEEDSVKVDKAS